MYYLYPYGEKSIIEEEFGEVYFNGIKTLLDAGKVKLFNDLYVISREKIDELDFNSRSLSDWIEENYNWDTVEICGGLGIFSINKKNIIDLLLDDLYDDTLTGIDECPSYADLIFAAENPIKKVTELFVQYSEIMLDIEMENMKESCEQYIKELKEKLGGDDWDEIY